MATLFPPHESHQEVLTDGVQLSYRRFPDRVQFNSSFASTEVLSDETGDRRCDEMRTRHTICI